MDNPATSGRTALRLGALESGGTGESNGLSSAESAWLSRSGGRKRGIPHRGDVSQGQEGAHWSPLAEGEWNGIGLGVSSWL